MIILITGASHTGKTLLAQRMLEKYKFPYLSIDHLKMGLIRSGNTFLTPEDDDQLTAYLWPIVREMIKTAIENKQNLIVEGCYIPFEWRKDFGKEYLRDINFICLAMTENYIDVHFDEIKKHASDIEARLDDGDCTADWIKAENRNYRERFEAAGELIDLIDSSYKQVVERALLLIPDKIKKLIAGKEYTIDDMGKSGSKILLFEDCVLKILDSRLHDEESSVEVLNWLKGKLPVPEVLAFEKKGDYQYLLMTRIPGVMSCSEYYMEHPGELLSLLAQAFKMLWSVDISGCPKTRDLDSELKEASHRVENDFVDIDDAEPDTFGENGFENPSALLKWLEENTPEYEPVLSHGDFCLPNIFLNDGKVSGFIDCGGTAIGDKWKDIALCYQSLKHNFDGTFGGKVYKDFDPDCLFDYIGVKKDEQKLKYYLLLDELF